MLVGVLVSVGLSVAIVLWIERRLGMYRAVPKKRKANPAPEGVGFEGYIRDSNGWVTERIDVECNGQYERRTEVKIRPVKDPKLRMPDCIF